VLSQHAAFLTCQPIRVSAAVKSEGDVPRQRPLDAKLALVTGAARGIGESIARALSREGAHVLCLDLPGDSEALQSLAEAIGGTALTGDVTQEDTLQTVRDVLKARGGESLDILVNNAGATRDKTLAKMREDHWDLTLAVNLGAVMRLTTSLPLSDGGRVVNLSSINGLAGAPGQTNYSATKAGVAGFTAAIGAQMAERGIAVNAVAPGFIETRMTAAVPAGTREAGRRLSALSQGGLPHDIAEAVTFLCSPGAAGLCGQTVRVCGGTFVGA
jgi:3-oxoacyl-[acyl-carrier protein] reductase